jgi:Na+/H+ antiporter NhaD/arsenite permease-like protein
MQILQVMTWLVLASFSGSLFAADAVFMMDMTASTTGCLVLCIFVIAYILVMGEELIALRKSKPMLLGAGLIWLIIAIAAKDQGQSVQVQQAVKHSLLEFGELLLFLIVAMTYVNAMEERRVFSALRCWLVKKHFSYRQLFWITGFLAFFISPVADNMTTALIMCAIVMAVGARNSRFIAIACINIVVGANAGGAFCPFGDITTLMVWQKGVLPFNSFFQLFIPSLVNFVIPALCMHFAIPKGAPEKIREKISIAKGGIGVTLLFMLTIFTAVCFQNYFLLPPTLGMMTGIGYLAFYSFYLKRLCKGKAASEYSDEPFDLFQHITRIEWDTLLFFYGVILCIGGLATLGYLQLASNAMYNDWGAALGGIHQQTPANIVIGVLSAIIDNIPLMYAVLTMMPKMSEGQWLLITLTTGVGGSLLSIGSAAGVALMGQAKGHYTFISHIKWIWAIMLGYLAAIVCHILINQHLFDIYV